MHACDICWVMDTTDPDPTSLTPTVLNNGCHGKLQPLTYNLVENNVGSQASLPTFVVSDGFTTPMPDGVFVRTGNQIFQPSQFRSMKLDGGTAFTSFQPDISSVNAKDICVFGLIKFEPIDRGAGGQLWDIWRFSSQGAGDFAVMQLQDGANDTLRFALNIESSKPATPTHSLEIDITGGGNAYWCSMLASGSLGKIYLAAWDATTLVQVGSTLVGACWTGADSWGDFRCGNDESATQSGKNLYFKGVSLDWTTPRLVPPIENDMRLPNAGVRPASFKPGIGR
jgi:hypothetical protein